MGLLTSVPQRGAAWHYRRRRPRRKSARKRPRRGRMGEDEMQAITRYADIAEIERVPVAERLVGAHVYDAIGRVAAKMPNKPAIHYLPTGTVDDPGLTYTYRQFFARITQTANLLHDLGIGPNDAVSLLLPIIPEAFFLLWGGEMAGIANPINPFLETPHIVGILKEAGTKVLVGCDPAIVPDIWTKVEAARRELPELKAVIRIGSRSTKVDGIIDYEDVIDRYPADRLLAPRAIKGEDVAALFHTGGTTGVPKLAQQTHLGQMVHAFTNAIAWDSADNAVILNGLPLFHVGGALCGGLSPFCNGSTVVMLSPMGMRNPNVMRVYFRIAERFRASSLGLVPTAWAALLNAPTEDIDLASVRYLFSGASTMPIEIARALERKLGKKLVEGYGMTEVHGFTAMNPTGGEVRIGSVGFRTPYTELMIGKLDGQGRLVPCATDEIGMVLMRGPQVFKGYVNPAHNKGAWFEGGWFNSGDLGRLDLAHRPRQGSHHPWRPQHRSLADRRSALSASRRRRHRRDRPPRPLRRRASRGLCAVEAGRQGDTGRAPRFRPRPHRRARGRAARDHHYPRAPADQCRQGLQAAAPLRRRQAYVGARTGAAGAERRRYLGRGRRASHAWHARDDHARLAEGRGQGGDRQALRGDADGVPPAVRGGGFLTLSSEARGVQTSAFASPPQPMHLRHAGARLLVGEIDDLNLDTVDALQGVRRDHRLRRADLFEATAMQQGDTVAAEEDVVGVVRREHDGDAGAGEGRDLAQDTHLIAEIERRGGLVHDQDARLLRQRAGDQHELALAAADLGIDALLEMLDAEHAKRALRHGAVMARGRGEEADMRAPPHQNDVDDVEGEEGGMRLRHVADDARDALPRPGRDVLAIEPHRAFEGRQQAQQRLHQGGLAAAVGAEEAQHLARSYLDADAAPDRLAMIAEAEIVGAERHCQPRRAVARSQRKKGAPMKAVRMPIGTSIAAMVRASVSTARRYPAPSSIATGRRRENSGPAMRRATCGMMRPIQPMMPLIETAAEVMSVAAPTKRMRRTRVSAPSARASSSPSDIRFIRQRRR